MLHVWPSSCRRSVASCFIAATASSSTRVASGRSVYRSKSKCTSSNVYVLTGRPRDLDGHRIRGRAPLPSFTVTVTGTVPSCCGAVHNVCRSAGVASVPCGVVQRYVSMSPSGSLAVAVTVEFRPTSTVHGIALRLHDRWPVRGGHGRRGRRRERRRRRGRRHVHAHARVIADADLPVDEVGRFLVRVVGDEVLPILHRDVPRQTHAHKEAGPVLPREPDVRLRQVLGRRDRRRDAAVVADHQAGPDRRHVVVGDRSDELERGAQRVTRREARPHPPRNAPLGMSKPSGSPRTS